MTPDEARVLPLQKAAEFFGAADLVAFRQAAKRLSCLIKVARLDFVDVDAFQRHANEAAIKKAEQLAAPKEKRPSTGSQKIGLYKARLSKAPKLIEGKEKKISAAQSELSSAANAYEKARATKKLQTLKAQLKNLRQQEQADEEELNRILNSTEFQSDAAA